MLRLATRPEPIEVTLGKSAVIVVDMQNDFGSKGGMFDRAGIDISGIQKAVSPTVKVLAAARKMGMKIVYLKMGYKPDLSDLGAPNSVNRVRHLAAGVGEKVTAPDLSRNWWHNVLNMNKLYEKLPLAVARWVSKHQFLAQVTEPQAFVIASY